MSRTYLDYNATAPLLPEAGAAMLQAMEIAGNPSSVHAEGRAAKAAVERARAQVAAGVGCKPQEVVFTGGATEAAQVLAGGAVVDPTAHDALWAHNAPEGRIYAMGLANSETGVISEVPQERPCELLLLDVTQAVGRIPFAFGWSGADLAILSAHKLGGPKGVGALIVREGLDIAPLLKGGGQEMGRRSGTENVIGIAGFGAAVEVAQKRLEAGDWARVAQVRDKLEAMVEEAAPEAIFVGQEASDGPGRLPNTSCFALPGWKGETQVMSMDLAGFAISAGSACSSGKVKESRVLRAMGFDEPTARSAIRVSLGPDTTEEDIARFAKSWAAAYRKHQARVA
ncbi:cysteine desulfurase [Oceanicola sp. D3]|uniref:cysteine desulfurase family protein n=1 Tax=Oceanicola sp. D3 TaxID=2587163 RepID=UPI001120B4E1|nr:cysteine desulfurase family protein [Oceanicola sp. D3]QDC09599.1 cysteine desulfurase [Oceanicola sp. D3]